MREYRGYKVLAEDLESISEYGIKIIGVWKGCLNPQNYLIPKPGITIEEGCKHIDTNPIVNLILENPILRKGEVARMSLFLAHNPYNDRLVCMK